MKNAITLTLLSLLVFFGLSTVSHAQTTHFITVTVGPPADGDGGVEFDADGFITNVSSGGRIYRCTVFPRPPVLTLFGTTATGTGGSIHGTVTQIKNQMAQNVVYSGSASVVFAWGGPLPFCRGSGTLATYSYPTVQAELAVSFVLNAGSAPPEIPGVPSWIVSPSCSNVPVYNWPNIDYLPKGVNDTYSSGWTTIGVCSRNWSVTRHWSCIPTLALKSTATGGYCSYNP